jgi:hypothetical protein
MRLARDSVALSISAVLEFNELAARAELETLPEVLRSPPTWPEPCRGTKQSLGSKWAVDKWRPQRTTELPTVSFESCRSIQLSYGAADDS